MVYEKFMEVRKFIEFYRVLKLDIDPFHHHIKTGL